MTFERQAQERARILAELQSLSESSGLSSAHIRADELAREYLRLIGANDLADAWEAVDKWYA